MAIVPATTHFRFVAWQVPTATQDRSNGDNPVLSGFLPGNECPAVVRIPVPDTVPKDARTRLKRLAAVVDRAEKKVVALGGDNESTLKIFMAPEFYFRPPSATGPAYKFDTYPQSEMLQIWGALDTMFQNNDFASWLIIPGTVMWNREDPFDEGPRPKTNYFNSAFRVYGGKRGQPTSIIEKKLPSDIDGVPKAFAPGNDPQLKQIYEAWQSRKDRIFEINGISMGLDVCLDHDKSINFRVVKNVLSAWQARIGEAGKTIKLHLLTAGGMDIEEASVAAEVNGYILRNDGFALNPRTELRKITGYKSNGNDVPPSSMLGEATMDPGIGGPNNTDLAGDELVPMKGQPYDDFTQRIVIYPARPLP